MKIRFAGWWALAVLLAGAGCAKKSTPAPEESKAVALVPAAERSRHFEAVNRHLELGGPLYVYADIDGDILQVADYLRNLADNISAAQPAAAGLRQDYRKIFADLGLADIKAVGLSSVPVAAGGFRNRTFFYIPGGRHGLLAGLGGPAAPFIHTRMAPADVDFYSEGEVDLPAVYATVKALVARIGGEAAASDLETKLREAGQPAGLSALELIQGFKGRAVVILALDPEKNLTLPTPQPITVPEFSLLIRIDGIGPALEPALAKLPLLEKSQDGTLTLYAMKQPLPIAGLQPAFAVEGSAFYLSTHRDFLLACQRRTAGLDQNPAFQRALAAAGPVGNGLTHVSPRLFARLHQLGELNQEAPAEVKRMLTMIAQQLPQTDEPLISVRSNLPDGVLVRSHWNRSLKQDLAVVTMYNPVAMGMLAAMAIPAFQKVREASQEKVILNNLRQLSAAADQHYLETGTTTATYDDLVGPGKLIPRLVPAMGEDYRRIQFRAGEPLRLRLPNGRVVVYPRGNRVEP